MKTPRNLAPLCCAALLATACGNDDTAGPGGGGNPPPNADYTYDLVDAFPNLTFQRPVDIRNAGDGSNRLFVVEQTGVIRVFANADTVSSSSVFLDITASVAYTSQSELGLLGLAFHPDYASNGYFFVYYTTGSSGNRHARLCRFQVSADPNSVVHALVRALDTESASHLWVGGNFSSIGNVTRSGIAKLDDGGSTPGRVESWSLALTHTGSTAPSVRTLSVGNLANVRFGGYFLTVAGDGRSWLVSATQE